MLWAFPYKGCSDLVTRRGLAVADCDPLDYLDQPFRVPQMTDFGT
jgi:hypothetical protein